MVTGGEHGAWGCGGDNIRNKRHKRKEIINEFNIKTMYDH